MALREDLDRVAQAALALAEQGEELAGIVPAEPQEGERTYLCAFASGDERTWLVLDDAEAPVTDREAVRRAATIAAMCELADESAGGGELDELRDRLMTIRLTESPDGIEEAEEAALALQQVIGAPPRVAEPGYLDRVGAATRRLELRSAIRAIAVCRGDEGGHGLRRGICCGCRVSLQATARLRARGYRSESWKAFPSAATRRTSCEGSANSPNDRPSRWPMRSVSSSPR